MRLEIRQKGDLPPVFVEVESFDRVLVHGRVVTYRKYHCPCADCKRAHCEEVKAIRKRREGRGWKRTRWGWVKSEQFEREGSAPARRAYEDRQNSRWPVFK
jgi:hypothetical protein